ncbi:MAG: VOC family protein [Bacteroidetes bacterium]|nr:VOC family protein [Bacteroidota bacterium]
MEFSFNKIQHVGIPVTDLKRSEIFYQKLGFENVMASSFDYEGEKGRVAMMQKGEMVMELYQFPEKDLREIRERKNGHVDHIAFDVSDIDQAFAELKREAFQVLEPAPVFLPFWDRGCKYFNIVGPDGERLEFNQIL